MSMSHVETDYLIIGSGAVGLAFADTLLAETEAHITIVDRQGKPGGHWNDAYPFVTLHQPSAFYGVNSLELGSGLKDQVGLNKGLQELASGPEVSGYFDRVMKQRLLPSGRVLYHPLCNHLGDGLFESLLSRARTQVTVRRKLVDATFYSPEVPATHTPQFAVDPGVQLVPPNVLPGLWHQVHQRPGGRPPRHFVVLGAGKTAMDACLWLVQAGADVDTIQWVVPRDSWLVNRVSTQNGPEFFFDAIGGQADQFEAFASANSVEDLFLRLEACGAMLRIDRDHMPRMFHFATVSMDELAVLRRIRHVIRLGHVQALHEDDMVLAQGRVPVAPDTLFIDCTASAVRERPAQAVFQGKLVVPQLLRAPLISFSAALAAYVEAHYDDEEHKNRLCTPVPFTHTLSAYPRTMLANMSNQFQWGQDKPLRDWIRGSRLDGFGKLMAGANKGDADQMAVLTRLKDLAPAAVANLSRMVARA